MIPSMLQTFNLFRVKNKTGFTFVFLRFYYIMFSRFVLIYFLGMFSCLYISNNKCIKSIVIHEFDNINFIFFAQNKQHKYNSDT